MTKPKLYIIGVNHFYQQPIEMVLLRKGGVGLADGPFYANLFSIKEDTDTASNHFLEMFFRLTGKFLTYTTDLIIREGVGLVFEEGFAESEDKEDNSMIKKAIDWKFTRISTALPQCIQIEPNIKERENINGNDYSMNESWCFSKEKTEEVLNWRENRWVEVIEKNVNNIDIPQKSILLIAGYCHLDGVFSYKNLDIDKEVFFSLKEPLAEKLLKAGFNKIVKINEKDLWENLDLEYWNYRKAKNDQRVFETS